MLKAILNRCSPTRGVTIDAIITKDDKILLIKRGRSPFSGFWALPGGHLDFDETLDDALKREVKEETNLKVISLRLFGVYSNPKRHPKQAIAIAYIVGTIGKPQASDDADEIKYFSVNKLPPKLAFDHQRIIDDYQHRSKLG